MAKRVRAVSFINGDNVLPVKCAKLSEHLPIQETDTVESISLPGNNNPSDSGNEFSSESEHEGSTFSAHGHKAKHKSNCKSKNAIMARINRIKKKKYIEGLELRTTQLEADNKSLRGNLNEKVEEIAALKREVLHLKNVIRNRTEIGTLLKCIHQNTNLKITSSILGNGGQNSLELSKPNVSVNKPNDTLKSPSTSEPTFSNSDEEALVVSLRHLWGMALHTLSSLQAEIDRLQSTQQR